MRKLSVIVLLLILTTQVAFAAGAQFKTKLYVYDADTSGAVNSNTNNILVMLGMTKGEGYTALVPYADQRVQGLALVARDAGGNEVNFTPVASNTAPTFNLNADGEEVRILGVFRKANPDAKLNKIAVLNLSAETVSSRGQPIALKAGAVVKLAN